MEALMVQREDVQFNSGRERISAWLYRPKPLARRRCW
jgi:hypothetical protein